MTAITPPTLPDFATEILGLDLSAHQLCVMHAIAGLEMPDDLAEHLFSDYWRDGARAPAYLPRDWMEVLLLCGVRSGKDHRIASVVAVYEAIYHKPDVADGEIPWVAVIAQAGKNARIAHRYIKAHLEKVEKHYQREHGHRRPLITKSTTQPLETYLSNGVGIGVWPATVKGIRGETVFCGIADELAHWWDAENYKNPAREVLNTLRNRMATIKRPRLLMLTTPWAKTGIVWDFWRRRQELVESGDMLIFHATTEEMNPAVNQRLVAKERRSDEGNYRREYLGQFTDSISGFFKWAELEPCILDGVEHVGRQNGRSHYAAIDASQRRNDDFALAIGHTDGQESHVDLVLSWGPDTAATLSIGQLLDEVAAVLREYGIQAVWADQYGVDFVAELLKQRGVHVEEYTLTQPSKAEMWLAVKAKVVSQNLRMVEHKQSITELLQLEERLTAGGGRKYTHPDGGHDDCASAIALLVHKMGSAGEYRIRRL